MTIDAAPRAKLAAKQKTSSYRVLGEGSSLVMNFASIGAILLLWYAATHLGLDQAAFPAEA